MASKRRKSSAPPAARSSRAPKKRAERTWLRVALPLTGLAMGLAGAALFTQSGQRALNHYVFAHKRVTFPEGSTRFDMAQKLQDAQVCSKAAFLATTEDASLLRELGVQGDSLEGYLFPATYAWPKNSDAREIARRMKREFDKRTAELLAAPVPDNAPPGWDARARLVLASVVEKEAQAPDERAHIAGVLLRRLTSADFPSRLLQSDPTAAYPCLRAREMGGTAPAPCAGYAGIITPALLHDASNVYSTYTHAGLPPGPICNPGLPALRAAVAPYATEDMYFVAKGGGRHTFSRTYEEHIRAVRGAR